MNPNTLQQGHHIQGLTTTSGHQILGNNFSAGGSNIFNINNGSSSEEAERKKCLRALFVSNPADDRAKYISFKGQVIKSTFTWIIQNDTYQYWASHATGSSLIWLSGGPGMGKTMLSIFLTEELERLEREKAIVLYYFCEGRDSRRSSPVNILRGLIFSLVQQRPTLIKHLLPDFDVQQEALFGPEGIEPLWRIMLKMVQDPETGPVYCIVDGLDECAQSSMEQLQHILLKFQSFYQQFSDKDTQINVLSQNINSLAVSESQKKQESTIVNTPTLKLALISREEPLCLTHMLSSFHRLRLERPVLQPQIIQQQTTPIVQPVEVAYVDTTQIQQQDTAEAAPILSPPEYGQISSNNQTMSPVPLQLYIQAKVHEIAIQRGYDDRSRAQLEQSLYERGDGSYLWVDSAIEQLNNPLVQDTEKAVANLPAGIEGIWCQNLIQFPTELAPTIALILRWVTVAFRPLTLVELKTIIIAETGQDDAAVAGKLVLALDSCRTLLDVSTDQEIKLGHQSIKDFLTRENSPLLENPFLQPYHVDMSSAHGEAAQTLIKYLEVSCFTQGWYDLVSAGVDPWTHDEIKPYEATLTGWPLLVYASLHWTEHMKQGSKGMVDFTTSFFQPGNEVRQNWFKSTWGALKRRDGRMAPSRQTILHVAAFFDLVELMEHLAKAPGFSSRVEKKNSDSETPLFVAATAGSVNVVAYFLDHGFRAADMSELFSFSISRGQLAVVKVLVARGADIHEISTEDFMTKGALALIRYTKPKSFLNYWSKALDKNDAELLDLLMENFGVEMSQLQIATLSGHYEIVKYLLLQGAKTQVKTSTGWTVTHFAAWNGETSMFDLLTQHGGDLHAISSENWTCLHAAARRGKIAAAEYLLERGLQIDARAARLLTPLHLAASHGHKDMVKYLLEHGADHTLVTDKGLTALHIAAKAGYDEIIKILIDFGANRDAVTNNGETALKLAKGGRSSTTAATLSAARSSSISQPTPTSSVASPMTSVAAISPQSNVISPAQPAVSSPPPAQYPPNIPGQYATPYQQNISSYNLNNQYQTQPQSSYQNPASLPPSAGLSQISPQQQSNETAYFNQPISHLPGPPPPLPPRKPEYPAPSPQPYQGYQTQYGQQQQQQPNWQSQPHLTHANSYPTQSHAQTAPSPSPTPYQHQYQQQPQQPHFQHSNSFPTQSQESYSTPSPNPGNYQTYQPYSPPPPPQQTYQQPGVTQNQQQNTQPYWAPPPAPAFSPPPQANAAVPPTSTGEQKRTGSLGALMD